MAFPDYTKLAGGTVYDPANGIDGLVRDIWIADGRIVEPPADPTVRPSRTIDASGQRHFAAASEKDPCVP